MRKPINRVTDQDIANFEESGTFDDYLKLASRTAIYPGQGTALGLMYIGLKLNGEAGEFAEHVGKALRDDNLVDSSGPLWEEYQQISFLPASEALTTERRELLIKELGDICWYVVNACRELGITPGEVLRRNLVKLADRTKRDQLQGSGDNR